MIYTRITEGEYDDQITIHAKDATYLFYVLCQENQVRHIGVMSVFTRELYKPFSVL